MTRDEHTAKIRLIQDRIKDIDDGTIVSALADLSDDYGSQLAEIDRISLDNQNLKNVNENLRDTNMRLFLKVGEPQKTQDNSTEEKGEVIKIKDLFNEKGELI